MIKGLFFKGEDRYYSQTLNLSKKKSMTSVEATSSRAFITIGQIREDELGVGQTQVILPRRLRLPEGKSSI